LTSIHVNSTLELNGLSRNDGKRPDGMTLVPWTKGQPLIWDVTIVDTLADGYVLKTSEVSGFTAEMACKRKHSKYSSIISSNYVFKGLAFAPSYFYRILYRVKPDFFCHFDQSYKTGYVLIFR
jgi:hypothetical protein